MFFHQRDRLRISNQMGVSRGPLTSRDAGVPAATYGQFFYHSLLPLGISPQRGQEKQNAKQTDNQNTDDHFRHKL